MLVIASLMRKLGQKINAGIEFLQFKPSEVAAAAALAAAEDSQILDFSNALSGIHVDKVRRVHFLHTKIFISL